MGMVQVLQFYACRMVGAVYGRIVGRLMVTMFGVHQEGYWEWMDPGAFALIGAASFFGGVTRLTLATTVIMVRPQGIYLLLIKFSKYQGNKLSTFNSTLQNLKCKHFLSIFIYSGQRS